MSLNVPFPPLGRPPAFEGGHEIVWGTRIWKENWKVFWLIVGSSLLRVTATETFHKKTNITDKQTKAKNKSNERSIITSPEKIQG